MSRRVSRGFLENASRTQLARYLESRSVEVYKDQSVRELRETALELHESSEPDESPQGMYAYGGQ